MFELLTDCNKCLLYRVCDHKNNARNAMEKLKRTQYDYHGFNGDYDWEDIMKRENVNIHFSCQSYISPAFEKWTMKKEEEEK